MDEILQRIELLESQLEILKQYTCNISDQQLKILELINRILESPREIHHINPIPKGKWNPTTKRYDD